MKRHVIHPGVSTGRQRGLTLLELLLAMSGLGLVGLAVAGLTTAMVSGTNTRNDLRELVVKHKAISARMTAAVRSSSQVLAVQDGWVLLWVYDTRDDDLPNVSELRLIERDAEGVLGSYMIVWPSDWTEEEIAALDIALPLDTDWSTVAAAMRTPRVEGQPGFERTTWARNVTRLALGIDAPNPQQAKLVSFQIDLSAGSFTDVVIGAAGLRNR